MPAGLPRAAEHEPTVEATVVRYLLQNVDFRIRRGVVLDHTTLPAINGQKTIHAAEKVARLALAGRPSLGRVLDVGCGAGNLLSAARRYAQSLTGVDSDVAALETARRTLPEASFAAGDVRYALPLPDAGFDTIFLCDVIEHLPNPFEPLGTISRLLAAGGHLVITTPDAGGLMRALTGPAWFGLADQSHILFFTRFTLDHVVRKAGFSIVRSQALNATPFEPLNRLLQTANLGGSLLTIATKPAAPA